MPFARIALTLAALTAALSLSLPPAAAHHDLCPGNIHALGSGASGTVWSGNDDHWLLVVTSSSVIVTLTPSAGDGDADLFILDPTCTVTIDSSTNFGSAVDRASAPAGVWEVRVTFFDDDNGDQNVDYTLSVS